MNKRIVHFLIVIAAMGIFLMGMQNYAAYAYIPSGVTSAYISGGYVPQQKTNWCWAASAENACIAENHHSYNQYYAVQTLKGTMENPYPNVSGTIIDAANAVGVISAGYLNYTYDYSLSFSSLADKIYNSYPVISGLLSSGGGHAVLIIGWDTSTGTQKITYYDPWASGSYHTCTFSSFCDGSYNSMQYIVSAYHS